MEHRSELDFDASETAALRARLDAAQVALVTVQTLQRQAEDNFRDTEARLREADEHLERWQVRLEESSCIVSRAQRLCDEAQQAIVCLQQAFTNPVRRLPAEILAEIFEICVCGDPFVCDSLAKLWVPYHPQQPFFLAAVCRRWRWACIGHARLWAFLAFDLHTVPPGMEGAYITYLDIILSRSRTVPLSLWVMRTGKTQARYRPFVQRILSAMPRCEDITLMISDLRANDSMLALLTTEDTPKLQYVSMSLLRASPARPLRSMRLFPGVCGLRRLKFEGDLSEIGPLVFPALLSAALERPVCTDERDDLAELLGTSPSLEALYLHSPKVAYDNPPYTQLAAPHLRTLSVESRAKHDEDFSLTQLAFRVDLSAVTELILLGDEPLSWRGILLLRALAPTVAITTLRLSSMSEPALLLLDDIIPSLTSLAELSISATHFTAGGWHVVCAALSDSHNRVLARVSIDGECSFAEDCKPDMLLDALRRRLATACDRSLEPRPALMQRLLVGPWTTHDGAALQAEADGAIAAAIKDCTSV